MNSIVNRVTNETNINLEFNIYGSGKYEINTGIGFLNHMLELMCFHGNFDLKLDVSGDLDVDDHHTIEDIALALGAAFKESLGDKIGIQRYGSIYLPMDETLVRVVVDISNRPYLVYKCEYNREKVGNLDTENIKEFFKSFVNEARITLHLECLYGENTHHKVEALFKGLGRCLNISIKKNSNILPSTKGVL